MNPRVLILMIFAGLSVLAVIMLTRSYLSGVTQTEQATQAQVIPSTRILVAEKDLKIGTIITPEHLTPQVWPDAALNPAYHIADGKKADLAGNVVRKLITAGEPITKTALVSQGERGFLAAILAPGMRAVTVKLNAESGIGGFIFPGDRVDVILTHQVKDNENFNHTVSETILTNIRVLGVDQRSEATENKVKLGKTATLEVSPPVAEKVTMLSKLGSLSLSLRALAGAENTGGRAAQRTFGSDITNLIPRLDGGAKGKVTIVRGAAAVLVEAGNTQTDAPKGDQPPAPSGPIKATPPPDNSKDDTDGDTSTQGDIQ